MPETTTRLPHPPLSPAIARLVARGSLSATPLWSNCSGKHAGMLALARHRGWELAGYESAGHPVQARILEEIVRWTGVPAGEVGLAVDGCTAVCFALPLQAMALAYARLGGSDDPAAVAVREAMLAHPELVAGEGRLCTDLMRAWPGGVLAKIGAEGIYCAALPEPGWGIALKVEDGDMTASGPALLAVLDGARARLAPELRRRIAWDRLAPHGVQPIRNTRWGVTGELRAAGALRFHAP